MVDKVVQRYVLLEVLLFLLLLDIINIIILNTHSSIIDGLQIRAEYFVFQIATQKYKVEETEL